MDDHDDRASSGFPSVRIWLCGPFYMEWVDPATGHASPLSDEDLRGKDAAQVLSLLKLLLCQPGRQAHRDQIMEQFWPEHAQSVASHRFHNITSTFRKLLCPQDGVPLLPPISGRKDSSSIYTLPAYPRLWVDSDAIAWNIEQAARMERFGDDALPFWQRAFDLLKRGPFLADELYASWAQAKRTELEGYYRHCVHALSLLYLTRYGHAGKAEALLLLQTYWQEHPSDEDALRPLMELLGEQERYQEAEACYQQCCLALRELGPGEDGQPRTPDPRTQDLREYLRTKQIQRERPLIHSTEGDKFVAPSSSLAPIRQSETPAPFSDPVTQGILEADRILEGNIMDQLRRQLLVKTLKGTGVAILASHNIGLVRPEIAERLTNALTRPLGLAGPSSLLHNEELLSIYTTDIPIYWRLYFDGHIAEVSRMLPECLSHLLALASQPSLYQKQAAGLASKVSQLACMLALQEQKFGDAFLYARQGFQHGEWAEDPNLQAASLIRKALVYFYLKKPEQKLQVYQEALQYEAAVSPLVRARIYMGLSEAYSNLVALGDLEREQEARHYLDVSYEALPGSPKEDPSFSYTHFGSPKGYESLLYLDLQQPQKAWDLLEAQSHTMPVAIVPDRVMLLLRQTRALIALGLKKESCDYFATSIAAARSLKSHLLVKEGQDVYQQLLARWHNERQVMELADLFLA
jgi:DNA-binding SARP family transcriptional activator/tetratricopeptide (TPR) repeat protein